MEGCSGWDTRGWASLGCPIRWGGGRESILTFYLGLCSQYIPLILFIRLLITPIAHNEIVSLFEYFNVKFMFYHVDIVYI